MLVIAARVAHIRAKASTIEDFIAAVRIQQSSRRFGASFQATKNFEDLAGGAS
jgi:hypothetical protein